MAAPGACIRLTNRSGGAPVLFRLDGQYPVFNPSGTRKLAPAQFSEVIPTPTDDPVLVTVTTTSPSVRYSLTVLPADVQNWPAPPALPAA